LNKNRWSLVILSVFLTIFMLFSMGCSGSTPEEEKAMEEVVEILTEDDSEDSADTSATDEPEKEEVEDTPIPRYSFVETYDYPPLASLDEFTNIIGLTDENKEKLDVRMDIEGNNVWGGGPDVEGISPEAAPFADIVFTARLSFEYEVGSLKIRPTSQFTCGYYNYEIPMWVVCPQGLDITGIDRFHVLVIGFWEDIPINHETHYGTVAAAMVPDNDPTGLWVPLPEYPEDHWQGTKRWYRTGYEPDMGWSSQAYNSDWTENPANFFTVFYRNLAVFYMSAADMAVEYPAGRATADWIDPTDWPGSFSGDVEGGNSTLDPFAWMLFSRITPTNETGGGNILPEGYSLCVHGGCFMSYGDSFPKEGNNVVSCECSGCTSRPGCDCALFSRENYFSGFTFEPIKDKTWEYVADANQRTLLDPKAYYNCYCVSK